MAPTLRSSAPNTPKRQPAGEEEPSSATPRKMPVCSKCKRPRAGHPRSGCPYTESPTELTSTPRSARKNLVDALGSMHLQSPRYDQDDDKATIRQRRRSSHVAALLPTQSVLSLDSESQEIIDRLMRPGIFDKSIQSIHDDGTSTDADKIIQSKEAQTPTKPKRSRIKMPGSMSSPSPSSSQEFIGLVEEPVPTTPEAVDDDALPNSSPTATGAAQSLVRSMSMEERENFLSGLSNSSAASVYIVPRDDIHTVHAEAVKVGFYARVILGKGAQDPQGFLVLGRDEAAVKRLYEQVEVERKKSSGFRAAAGGAVVGAVGAFAGLAFA